MISWPFYKSMWGISLSQQDLDTLLKHDLSKTIHNMCVMWNTSCSRDWTNNIDFYWYVSIHHDTKRKISRKWRRTLFQNVLIFRHLFWNSKKNNWQRRVLWARQPLASYFSSKVRTDTCTTPNHSKSSSSTSIRNTRRVFSSPANRPSSPKWADLLPAARVTCT